MDKDGMAGIPKLLPYASSPEAFVGMYLKHCTVDAGDLTPGRVELVFIG